MAPCGWCMPLALGIVVPVRYASSANGTGLPPRNHGGSVPCCIHTSRLPSLMSHYRRVWPPTLFCGETGNDAPIGASGSSSFVPNGSTCDRLNSPHRLIHHHDLFAVQNGHIGDFRGPNGWLAMPLRRQHLPSRSPSLGSQTPLPLPSACRRSNPTQRLCWVCSFLNGISVGADCHASFPSLACSFSLLCLFRLSRSSLSRISKGRNLIISGYR